MSELGALVKSIREERGITQEQLAEQIGKSQRWISTLETTNTVPRRVNLLRLARALSIDISELYIAADWAKTRQDAHRIEEQAPPYDLTNLQSDELLQLFDRLPDPDRDRLVAIARALFQLSRE